MDRALGTSSCRAKIARADEHLKALYDQIYGWTKLQPCSVSRQSNADGSEHEFTLHISPQPDLWRWAVLMGDALHCLRSALDHIVYFLAIQETGSDPPDDDERLAFPITTDAGKFGSAKVRRIASLSGPMQASIERLQPYNRGKREALLWLLQQLNDIDKHRLCTLMPLWLRRDSTTLGAEPGTFRVLYSDGPYVDGAPIMRISLTKPNPNVYVDLSVTGSVVIQSEQNDPLSVVWLLPRLRQEVVIGCRYLAQFFEEPTERFDWPYPL